MFEVAEGNFTAPSEMINQFNIFRRERRIRKIRDKILEQIFTGFNFYDPKLQNMDMVIAKKRVKVSSGSGTLKER